MQKKPVNIAVSTLVSIIIMIAGRNVIATTVYQWTDEEGVVHFSDVAPRDNNITEIDEIEFTEYAATHSEPDRYSISSQLERMTEWRRQITEERLARRRLELEEKRIAREKHASRYNLPPPDSYYMPAGYYSPVIFANPGYVNGGQGRWRHHHIPRKKSYSDGYSLANKNFDPGKIDHSAGIKNSLILKH